MTQHKRELRFMTTAQAVELLKGHKDPEVRAAITLLQEAAKRRKKILSMVQEALTQVRLDMKYLVFDLECTRRERDEAKGGAV